MKKTASIENIYHLEGKVPVGKAIPFGLQHILAMFVANIAPILIVAGASGLDSKQSAMLIQSAMVIAGIGTLIQLFPIWKVGSGLPIVMGISFTFVSVMCYVGPAYGYNAIVGAVLVGGIIEGFLGLFAKYWTKIITPIVSASVVTAIGFSLLSVGATSFGGGSGSETFGSATNWILGTITLLCCLLFNIFAKSYWKQLSVLVGLIVGYIVAFAMGVVDFSAIKDTSIIALPSIMPFKPEFNANAIISVVLIFLVSATETIGDTSALANSGLGREVTKKEISGSLACDGFISALSSVFGCLPITSFSQNVGLVAMTKIVNRFTIATGAVIMILAGVFPVFGAILATLPDAVLGGCTIMMFGTIVISGLQMMSKCGYSQRNITIAALSLSTGIGFTQVPEIFGIFPQIVENVFAENCVAVVFLVAVILNLILPKNMEAAPEAEA
ncbi:MULTISPECIES: uracil-xanthine permease family protein [Anaerostipes]|uniref:uracil-xanthine permease family protein n=1 Tax=Anaerostipes TaxID=207244 RepID=UPI00095145A7|nr:MULTISPECIES: nucleobase:cation symporter-2 family protein [Anaerostipes]MCI5623869.1 purine permease [Anaerostipes sp.]MDY2725265.1 nucleobase:cation symporter-2 family protein [Anaerostipes faecalis]OLR59387.1 uracil permease [Anaerostipes sp. 494a]